jgi:hypothetical protein
VRYCRIRSVIPSSYTIDNVTLAIVEVKKDLGVTFVNTLAFKTHIDNIVNSSLCYGLGLCYENSSAYK